MYQKFDVWEFTQWEISSEDFPSIFLSNWKNSIRIEPTFFNKRENECSLIVYKFGSLISWVDVN